jgi:hypothetical protein
VVFVVVATASTVVVVITPIAPSRAGKAIVLTDLATVPRWIGIETDGLLRLDGHERATRRAMVAYWHRSTLSDIPCYLFLIVVARLLIIEKRRINRDLRIACARYGHSISATGVLGSLRELMV